jgi:hypothetical protein
VAAAIVLAIGLQLALPDELVLVSRWLLAGVELVLLVGLIVANPARFDRESPALRTASLSLTYVGLAALGENSAKAGLGPLG